MTRRFVPWAALVSLAVVLPSGAGGCGGATGGGPGTVAEVEVVLPGVSALGHAVAGATRLAAGGEVGTSDGGRALLRHDRGARLLLDGKTRLTVREAGVALDDGRVFVEAPAGVEALVRAGAAEIDVAGAGVEVARGEGGVRLYVARGEVAVRSGRATAARTVHAGEGATLVGGELRVAAAALWDDWTGGLAWPDPGRGGAVPAGRGEIGARRPGSLGEARFPLAVTRLEVRTRIEDDLAITRVVETFFNPASDTLEGLYRMRVPEGALLERFAIDRDGRWADGYVKERETARAEYQAQVYEGSTKDPALLEWEAPGQFRARIYPLPPGATRRILVEYGEWLTPRDGGRERTFRYPLAAAAGAGVVEELDVEVDATRAGATELRAGLDARIDKGRVRLERTDFRAASDLVVNLLGPARPDGEARAVRAPHRVSSPIARLLGKEDDYFLVRAVPLAAEAQGERRPLDVVILADLSAGTDGAHLQLARTAVEALVRHLDERDRVAVLGVDLELRAGGGGAALRPATREAREQLLEGLAHQRAGGATDLGKVLTQAASLLDPKRRGAVVYVGDALPTVGELDVKALRERLDRLPAPLRLYGVAIGDEADLALLDGLAGDGGLALRVGDRTAAATAALRILAHAARRAMDRVTVDVGAGLDRVYPRRAVTVLEGEALTVMARVRTGVPKEVTITGFVDGAPVRRALRVATRSIDDASAREDVRLRWASERLRQLLADGASGEEVAELGTRQNLVTPFTSFYVPSADELSALLRRGDAVRAAGFGCARSTAPSSAEAEGASSDRRAQARDTTARAAGERVPEESAEAFARVTVPSTSAPRATAMAPPPPARASAPRPERGNGAAPLEEGGMGRRAGAEKPRKGRGDEAAANAGLLALFGSDSPAVGGGGAAGAPGSAGIGSLASRGPARKKVGLGAQHGRGGERDKAGSIDGLDTDAVARALEGSGAAGIADLRGTSSSTGATAAKEPDSAPADRDADAEGDADRVELRISLVRHRPRHCSAAASLSEGDRAVLWRERLAAHRGVQGALEVWQDAGAGCELRSWGDRRELLRAMLDTVGGAAQMVQLHQSLAEDPAAQDFLRRAILGAVKSAADLRTVTDGLGLSQEVAWTLVEELLARARTPEARVAELEQLLVRWPGDLRLELRLVEALEAAHRTDDARRLADRVRQSPYADAQARTLVGEFLVRAGDEPAARRAFSEIVEFAPRDPLARRRLGDLYRAHGWFDEAYRQYQTLAAMAPGDGTVLLLEALAAAGAGRTDEALRLEQRVADATEPGTPTGLARAALWWSTLRLALLRDAARRKGDAAELARLEGRTRRMNVQGEARALHVFLTFAHPEADCELWAKLPGGDLAPAVDVAPELGIESVASREAGETLVEVRRPAPGAAASGLRYRATLVVVWSEGDAKTERLATVPIDFGPGKVLARVRLDGGKAEVLP